MSVGSYGRTPQMSAPKAREISPDEKVRATAVALQAKRDEAVARATQRQAAAKLAREQRAQAQMAERRAQMTRVQNQVEQNRRIAEARRAGAPAPSMARSRPVPTSTMRTTRAPQALNPSLRQAPPRTPRPTASMRNRPMAPVMPTTAISPRGGSRITAAAVPNTPGTPLHQPTRLEGRKRRAAAPTALRAVMAMPIPQPVQPTAPSIPVTAAGAAALSPGGRPTEPTPAAQPPATPKAPAPPPLIGGGKSNTTIMPIGASPQKSKAAPAAPPAEESGLPWWRLLAAGIGLLLLAR